MSNNSSQLGLLIRKFYKNKGLTQKDFAKKIGYSRSYISEIVTGRRVLSEDIKISFSNKFGFEIEDLLKKGKDSQVNKSKEGKKMNKNEKILYGLEDLSQERLDQIQETIDNWMEEDLQKRREKRRKAKESKPKKNHKSA